MKRLLCLLILLTILVCSTAAQGVAELLEKNRRLENDKVILQNTNVKLQGSLSDCERLLREPTKGQPCPESYIEKYYDKKAQVDSLNYILRGINQTNDRIQKESTELVNAAQMKADAALKQVDLLETTNKAEVKRLIANIDSLKARNAAYQDSMKSLDFLRQNYQILYDSLYFSIDFKRDIVHLDIKEPNAKDAKLGDILIEIPDKIIIDANWTANNVEKKMKRIAALYVKYRDKLKIQLIAAPIETEKGGTEINNILIKVIRKLNIYASVVMPSDNQVPITEKDFEIIFNNQGKDGVIRVALVKK